MRILPRPFLFLPDWWAGIPELVRGLVVALPLSLALWVLLVAVLVW